MTSSSKENLFYKKLKAQLLETENWPAEYLFKFIVTSSKSKIETIENLFNNYGAVINTKESKNGKYTSISINLIMNNPDSIIKKYKEVGKLVKDVIAL